MARRTDRATQTVRAYIGLVTACFFSIQGCMGDVGETDVALDEDVSDSSAQQSFDRVSCDDPQSCREDQFCIQWGAGSCAETILGLCKLKGPLCPPHAAYSDGWRGCACGEEVVSSLCLFREMGRSERVFLCHVEFEGAECDASSTAAQCPDEGVCVLIADGDPRPNGRCMARQDACSTAPREGACVSNLDPQLEQLGLCTSSPCDLWGDGYRGPIAFSN